MAGTLKLISGPAYLAAAAADIYTPPASTIYTVIRHIHIANVTGGSVSFTLYKGATGGSTGGTEVFKSYAVAANSSYDYYCNMKMLSTDFLTGLAGRRMTTSLSPSPKMQFFDANGNPLVGGKLYTYAAGTVTPLATYTNSGGGTPNTNPIILDSRGEANVWLGATPYYMELKTSADALVWTVDNITPAGQSHKYVLGAYANDVVNAAASEIIFRGPLADETISFVADLVGSRVVAKVAATAQSDWLLNKNDSLVGTIRFAAAGTVATFVSVSAFTITSTDTLSIVAPASADATLDNIGFMLLGAW